MGEEAESSLDYLSLYNEVRKQTLERVTKMDPIEAFTSTACKTAFDAGAVLIVVLTESGRTARFLAKWRPKATIVAVGTCEAVARSLNTLRGVISLIKPFDLGPDTVLKDAIAFAQRVGVEGVVTG